MSKSVPIEVSTAQVKGRRRLFSSQPQLVGFLDKACIHQLKLCYAFFSTWISCVGRNGVDLWYEWNLCNPTFCGQQKLCQTTEVVRLAGNS